MLGGMRSTSIKRQLGSASIKGDVGGGESLPFQAHFCLKAGVSFDQKR
jgi:hypothetical protein